MPSNPRTKLKKKTANALHHISYAAQHLIDLHEIFEPDHPDFADFLDVQIATLLKVKEWTLDFWERAWGQRPDDYERWR